MPRKKATSDAANSTPKPTQATGANMKDVPAPILSSEEYEKQQNIYAALRNKALFFKLPLMAEPQYVIMGCYVNGASKGFIVLNPQVIERKDILRGTTLSRDSFDKFVVALEQIPYPYVVKMLQRGAKFMNAEYDASSPAKIKFFGASMNELPVYNATKFRTAHSSIAILQTIVDDKDNVIAYDVVYNNGNLRRLVLDGVINALGTNVAVNFETYTVDKSTGKVSIRSKHGAFARVHYNDPYCLIWDNANIIPKLPLFAEYSRRQLIAYQKKLAATQKAGEKGKAKREVYQDPTGIIVVRTEGGSVRQLSKTDLGMQSVLQNGIADVLEYPGAKAANACMIVACHNLGMLSTFFSTMVRLAKPQLTLVLPTMAVDESKMYYNPDFVTELVGSNNLTQTSIEPYKLASLMFVLIHEMCHLAMYHSFRGRGKDHELWNIATDLYINEWICATYGCKFGGEAVQVSSGVWIKTPSDGVFLDTISHITSKSGFEERYTREDL